MEQDTYKFFIRYDVEFHNIRCLLAGTVKNADRMKNLRIKKGNLPRSSAFWDASKTSQKWGSQKA